MGLQIPSRLPVCTECVWRASSSFTGTVAAGLAASLQFFKSRWMKESGRKEHCAQLLLLLPLYTAVYLVFFRPKSIKWERKKNKYAHTTQHNNFTVFLFWRKKKRTSRRRSKEWKKNSDGEWHFLRNQRCSFYFLVLVSIHDNSCLDRACIWRSSASWWEQCLN